MTLHGSDSYRFITVADNGIVSSYNPRTVSGDVQTSVYVSRCVIVTVSASVVNSSVVTTELSKSPRNLLQFTGAESVT